MLQQRKQDAGRMVIAGLVLFLGELGVAGGTWSDAGGSNYFARGQTFYDIDIPPADPGCPEPPAPGWAGCPIMQPPPPNPCNDLVARGFFVPGFAGRDYGQIAVAETCRNSMPGCRVTAEAFGRATAEGLGTDQFTVRWKLNAYAYHTCECPFTNVWGSSQLAADFFVAIDTVPVGVPVTVHVAWWAEILNQYDPEDDILPDDPSRLNGLSLQVQGTELVPQRFRVVNGVGAAVYLPASAPSVSTVFARGGDVIHISVAGNALAQIRWPPKTCWNKFDQSRAMYRGWLTLSIDEPVEIPDIASPEYSRVFSVDIGSDAEMSDPNADGDEALDPGDLYAWGGPLLAGPTNGLWNDVNAFALDYWPDPTGGLATAAETCQHGPAGIPGLLDDRFDLDGADRLDFAITSADGALIPPNSPLTEPIGYFASDCVSGTDYLVVSLDDDPAAHYGWDAFCDVPVAATSPGQGATYGTATGQDEAVNVGVTLTWPTGSGLGVVDAAYGMAAERDVHRNLAPDPDVSEADDDDVDALAFGRALCVWWYFSPDHEATGAVGALALNPGAVYQALGPPSYAAVQVVDPAVHLGLPAGTDVDAFVFVWLEACDVCPRALALLFSVDYDDFLTSGVDESGGLDPHMIYYSFFDGGHAPLLPQGLSDDIDALTTTPVPFRKTSCQVVGGAADCNGNGNDDGCDILSGVSADCDGDGVPDECQILAGTAADCNGNGVLDACETVAVDVTAAGGFIGKVFTLTPPEPQGVGSTNPETMRDGDLPPVGSTVMSRQYDTFHHGDQGNEDWLGYAFAEPQVFRSLTYQEGVHRQDGGWFDTLAVQVRQGGVWQDVSNLVITPPYPGDNGVHYETFAITFDPVAGDAIRLYGEPGGSAGFINAGELRVIAGQHATRDCNGNGVLDACDIAGGVSDDADGNGVPDECEAPVICRGDANCDGVVNWRDIDFFVAAQNDNVSGWTALFAPGTPSCPFANNDVNADGTANWRDIDPFVNLQNTTCP